MRRDIIIHNEDAIRQAIEDIQCGNRFGLVDAIDFHELPKKIQPIESYQKIPNFPNCCELHISMVKSVKEWFQDFPNCCDEHKRLLDQEWFDKARYENIEITVLERLAYTTHFIDERINNEDWFKDITDYIEFIALSFGHPTIGQAPYIELLIHEIKKAKEDAILTSKKNKLLNFLIQPDPIDYSSEPDINVLQNIYNQWIDNLPDLDILKEPKASFRQQMPFFKSKHYNPYLQAFKLKLRLKSELIDILHESTKVLLNEITGDKLIKNNIIQNIQKHQYQLLLDHHANSQNIDLEKYEHGELKYLNVLNKWLEKEKLFFSEIEKFIKVKPKKKNSDPTLLELFRDKENYKKFFSILKNKNVKAISEDNEWEYLGRKSSIVACFSALEDLEIIKNISSKALLYRVVKSEIKFEGTEKLFRNPVELSDSNFFTDLFLTHLKSK